MDRRATRFSKIFTIFYIAFLGFAFFAILDPAIDSPALAATKKSPQKAASNSNTFTIGQAVEEALRANPGVEAKRLMLENARMNIGVAQSFFWPRVSVVWTNNRIKNYEEVNTYNSDNLSSFNWSKGLRVNYPLFVGFAHLSGLQKSMLQKDLAAAQHRLACLELASNVQLQFLQLLRSREDLRAAKDSIKRLEAQLASAEAFVEMDMAPYLNVLQNRTDLANARQQLIRVQNDIRNCEVQLNRYLGRPEAANIRYVGNLKDISSRVDLSEEQAIKESLANRPDLTMAQKSIEIAFKDMRIAMAQYLPRIDLNYDNMSSSKDYEDGRYEGYTRYYWSAGITFTWEFFSGGQTTFSTLAEKKRADSLRKDYEEAVNNARAELIRSMLDINAAKDLIKVSQTGLKTAREAYDMATTRYETDTGTITELLDAQQRLTQAENEVAAAHWQLQSARSRWFFYLGRDNPSLK